MCGIVGILGTDRAPLELYNGLFAIQHRGQNGSGIYIAENGKTRMIKGPGLVGDVFDKNTLTEMRGNMGIGHVRYPTIGSEAGRDAQPFQTVYPLKIGMAHNGNIVNYKQIEEEDDLNLESQCDLELILAVFSRELAKEDDIDESALFRAVGRTMDRLNGSYSVIAIVQGFGLLMFRDPHGIRPMIFGKKVTLDGASFAVASENIVLDILGYDILRDVKPGEAILVRETKTMETRQVRPNIPRNCMFEWVYFARTDSTIERTNVYEARLRLGRELANEWKKNEHDIDVVIPIPDTARTYALAMAEELDAPYREGLLRNRYVGRTFIMPDQLSRETGVRTKLNPIIEEVKGKKVALVDDSIVRGTTSKKLVQLVRRAGAKEVHFLVGCPPIKAPCYYGIDMPTKKELTAASKDIEEIKEDIGCDSLTYQSIEGLVRGLGRDKSGLCLACLNEDYPTRVREDIMEYFGQQREKERKEFKASDRC
ncbi:MAG: amidophosphoribosyltransferase [Candidatus Saliniplasma sp.]